MQWLLGGDERIVIIIVLGDIISLISRQAVSAMSGAQKHGDNMSNRRNGAKR